jgi:hypothetical protein
MTGVTAPRADVLIRFTPIAQLRLYVRPIAFEGGAKLHRWNLDPRIPRITAVSALRDRCAGE